MKKLAAIALLLLLLFAPATTSCKAAAQAVDSSAELVSDAWIPFVAAAVGAIFGPIGAVIGGTFGGAYAASRQKLYSAQDLAEQYRKGEIWGRQQAIDLADAARAARIQTQTAAAKRVPWYRQWWVQVTEAVLIVLTLRGLGHLPRVVFGPNRLRAFLHIYVGWLAKLPSPA